MENKLQSFKITFHNGLSYITNMASYTTIEDAKKYFLGKEMIQCDEKTLLKVINVEIQP